MHVVEPARYLARPKRRPIWPYPLAAVCIVVVIGVINYVRPLPATTAHITLTTPAPITPDIAWPTAGQASIAADMYGMLGSSGAQTPLATASTAKVIAALCVLQKDPLSVGQTGPTFTVNADDVSIYNNYVAEDGSLVPVTQGEQLTEYQALEALMIPSANNIADSLVRWVFGSQSAYETYAAKFLQGHGLTNTHIGMDASGFDPSTTSTSGDLTKLGLLALQSPVLMQIAGQSTATLPTVGVVHNYDTVLGQGGITGLKTGNNNVDMGAFIFTSTAHIGNKTIPITGAVMGASSLNAALQSSVQLAESMQRSFQPVVIAKPSQQVGTISSPWGTSSPLIATSAIQLVRWEATPIKLSYAITTKRVSGTVGTLNAVAGPSSTQTSLKLARPLAGPSFWWRLTRH